MNNATHQAAAKKFEDARHVWNSLLKTASDEQIEAAWLKMGRIQNENLVIYADFERQLRHERQVAIDAWRDAIDNDSPNLEALYQAKEAAFVRYHEETDKAHDALVSIFG